MWGHLKLTYKTEVLLSFPKPALFTILPISVHGTCILGSFFQLLRHRLYLMSCFQLVRNSYWLYLQNVFRIQWLLITPLAATLFLRPIVSCLDYAMASRKVSCPALGSFVDLHNSSWNDTSSLYARSCHSLAWNPQMNPSYSEKPKPTRDFTCKVLRDQAFRFSLHPSFFLSAYIWFYYIVLCDKNTDMTCPQALKCSYKELLRKLQLSVCRAITCSR